MRFKIYTFIMFLFAVTSATAKEAFYISAPERVSVGDKFYITLTLKDAEASQNAVKSPQINGCTLIYGPTLGQQSTTQYINGNVSHSVSTDYTYIYRADKEGTYTIPSTTINTTNGKKLSTSTKSITITKGTQNTNQPSQSTIDDPFTQTTGKEVKANDVFVRINLSKSSAFEQEAIECTVKVYTTYDIIEFIPTSQPNFDGFLVEDIDISNLKVSYEQLNGQRYATAILKKCILFPQKAGKLTINSGNYDLTINQYEKIDLGFHYALQPVQKKIKISSNKTSVDIKPLPSPVPPNFNGAVGKFSISYNLTPNSIRTNETATLNYKVSGKGNIRYLKEPEIDFPTEFEQYSPQINIDASVNDNNVSGVYDCNMSFIPKEVGDYSIIIPDFVYFDTETRNYVTLEGKEYNVKVLQGISSNAVDRKGIEAKNTDIRYIHTNASSSNNSQSYVIVSYYFWSIIVIVILILVLSMIIANKNKKSSENLSVLRLNKANKVAKRRLKEAYKYLLSKNDEAFYAETLKALNGYLGDKLGIDSANLSRLTITQAMESYRVDSNLVEQTMSLLDTCEMARYAPVTTENDMPQSIYQRTSQLINSLERIKFA